MIKKYIEKLSKIYDEMYQDSVESDIYSDVMQDIDNALQKLRDNKLLVWKRYITYLKGWADTHSDVEFMGMSPACFDEFCDVED